MKKFLSVLSWVFAVIFIVFSLAALSENQVLPGIFLLLIGLVLIPPLSKALRLNLLVKSVLILVFAVLTIIAIPKDNTTTTANTPSNVKPVPQTISSNAKATRVVEEKWPDGKLWQRYSVDDNNKKQGLATYWNESGVKTVEENYVHGIENGQSITFHENGNKNGVYNYVNGKIDGLYTEWHENGVKALAVNYVAGLKNGTQTTWYDNGNISSKTPFVNDTINGIDSGWCENGRITWVMPYVMGKENGIGIRYDCTTGKPEIKRKYNMGKFIGPGW
jgi:antitoxin component YwqK of YwqJK toxin-antitoxin module